MTVPDSAATPDSPSLTISYNGPPVDIDPQQITHDMWVPMLGHCSDPYWCDEHPGEVAASLFKQAAEVRALIIPPGLHAECYGNDDTDGSCFTIVIYPGSRSKVGITCGWRDVKNIASTRHDWRFANDPVVVAEALVFIAIEMNTALGLNRDRSPES